MGAHRDFDRMLGLLLLVSAGLFLLAVVAVTVREGVVSVPVDRGEGRPTP